MVYSTLLSLPQSYFENPYNVMIIPAFSLAESVLNPENCTGLKPCVEKSFFPSWLRNRALTLYPQTREELVDCLNKNRCEFFRPYTKTHVSIITLSHLELSSSQLDNDSQECALHSRSLLQREVLGALLHAEENESHASLRWAFHQLRLQQGAVDWASSLQRLWVQRAFSRFCWGYATSIVFLGSELND